MISVDFQNAALMLHDKTTLFCQTTVPVTKLALWKDKKLKYIH